MRTDGREKMGEENLIIKRMIGANDILIGGIVEVNIEDIYLTVTLPDVKNVDPSSFPCMTILTGRSAVTSAGHIGRDFKHRTK
jgi:hypothetical protein